MDADAQSVVVGRYVVYDEIASGGMATVHLGRLVGSVGFSRVVAIKRLRPQFARDPEFVEMLVNEAHLAARIRHPNVVGTIDTVAVKDELLLVMEYVQGASLSRLTHAVESKGQRVSPAIAVAILSDALHGLHAAHESCDERGQPLGVVHRDVSPQNLLVGTDGIARVADFGIAKATLFSETTKGGALKGKLSYMAPEQLTGATVDRRTDVFAASVVLWESLTGKRLFAADDSAHVVGQIMSAEVAPPSTIVDGVPPRLDAVVLRGLSRDPNARFGAARDMATALESALAPAGRATVAAWVEATLGDSLRQQSARLREIESASVESAPVPLARSEAQTELIASATTVDTPPVSTDAPPARSRAPQPELAIARRPRREAWLALAGLGALAVVWVLARVLPKAESDARISASADSEPPLASAPELPPTGARAAQATSTPEPPESSAPSAAPASTTGHTPPRPPAGSVRARSDCNPPFSWDAVRKIKVYKEHCFK
jgi:eukaryotic-like serine/threonine-protein kinase